MLDLSMMTPEIYGGEPELVQGDVIKAITPLKSDVNGIKITANIRKK